MRFVKVTRPLHTRPLMATRYKLTTKAARGFGEPKDREDEADALARSLAEVAKTRGRVSNKNNLVLGGPTTEAKWRQLDQRVNTYPSQRSFTAIGYGGTDFVDSIVAGVEKHVGKVALEWINKKESSGGKYLSVTIGPVWVDQPDQVVEVYKTLREDERVKWCM